MTAQHNEQLRIHAENLLLIQEINNKMHHTDAYLDIVHHPPKPIEEDVPMQGVCVCVVIVVVVAAAVGV